MPTNLKSLITALAKKAGMKPEDDAFKAFFDALPESEVPDDVQKGLDNSLISLTDAMNNHPQIRNKYKAEVLNGVDKSVEDLLAEFELTDDDEIKNEPSSFKRIGMVARKVAKLKEAKAAAGSGTDKAKIQQEIDALHGQLAAEKKARGEEKADFDKQLKNFKLATKMETLYGSKKTIHDELDPEVKTTVLNTLINKALQDNQAKFDFDESGNLLLLKNDGSNYYGENHQQIKPDAFIESVLAKSKLLKVSNGQSNGNNNQSNYQAPASTGAGDKPNINAALIERNAREAANFAAQAATSVG